jgi:hypothetical protein
MTDMTYDPGADALYIYVGAIREIDHQEEAGPFIYDVDTKAGSSASKSCRQAKFWLPANGKTRGGRGPRTSMLPSSGP